MLSLFKSPPILPASFERWSSVDVLISSELIHEGPSIRDVRSLKCWLDVYRRWRSGYDEFIKSTGTISDGVFLDAFDRRQYEHYAGLLLQSGQWRAILLMLLDFAVA